MIGSRLGSYELRAELGSGGMATVYRAYQPAMDREVALKVIHLARADDEVMRARFRREALLIARLEHPNILPVYDFDGGHHPPYIVMRYLDRGTLRELLAARPLTLTQVATLIVQVAAALDYAHAQGIVHRDVKPSNILLDRHGNAFVSDFGIARIVGAQGEGGQITGTGAIIGTPDYMAPEQAQGRSDVDGRADVYALGVVLFQMLTGRLPYEAAAPMGVLLQHLQAPIPSAQLLNAKLPSGVDALLAQALAKAPADRPSSAGALVQDLMALLRSTRGAGRATTTMVLEARAVGATPTPPPLERQRVITTVIANAAEYIALTEATAGGEAARAAAHALWAWGDALIVSHGGYVAAQREHEVLAVWGAEVAREDDTERAIRAALALQQELRARVGSELTPDEPLPIAIGVHTGPALLTADPSTSTLTVSGSTITVAERLAAQAEGTIRISHATFRQVRGVFDVLADTPLKIRGRPEPLETYVVTGAKAQAFRVRPRGIEGVEGPLVGRDAELHQLREAFLTVVEEGEVQVVTIIGDAGLGKTKLVDAFDQWADLRPESYRIFATQLPEASQTQPYAVLRGLLAFRFAISADDAAPTVRAKLEQGVAELLGAPDDLTAQLMGHLAGFDLRDAPHVQPLLNDPRSLVELARQRVMQFFTRLCAREPVVVTADAMEHADDASIKLLTMLAQATTGSLLLILMARPTFLEQHLAWGGDRSVHRRLVLGPLDRRASRELARALLAPLGEVPKELRDLLVERSAGNPLYLEELVRMLLDERIILRAGEGRWRLEATRLHQLAVPPTLYGLLQARLDSLVAPERLTLQRASVLGPIFAASPLHALDAADETHLADPLAPMTGLVAHGFIELRADSPVFGHAAYAFSQTMLRDLVYETLLDRQRRSYHQAYATWLVARDTGRQDAALIAEHSERGGLRREAASWRVRAGNHARETYTIDVALRHYGRALELLPTNAAGDAERIACYEGLGEVQLWAAHLGDAAASYRHMAELADAAGDPVAAARGWNGLAFVQDHNLEYLSSKASAQRAVALAESAGATSVLALGLFHLAWAELRLNNLQAAHAIGEQALALLAQADEPATAARWTGLLGVIYDMLGDAERASFYQHEALRYHQGVGNLAEVITQLNNLGSTSNLRGDFTTALGYLQEAQLVSDKISSRVMDIFILSNLGITYNGLGEYQAAEETARRGIELSELSRMPVFSEYYYALSEACLWQGRVTEAVEAAQQALNLAHEHEGPREVAAAWRALGMATSATPIPSEAPSCFAESARLFAESGARGDQARTLRAWAAHAQRHGDPAHAAALLHEARTSFEAMGLSHELARTPQLLDAPAYDNTGEALPD